MISSISHSELLTITDEKTNQFFFGGIQDWYSTEWSRKAGCGPTCAADILAYLALTRGEFRPLYGYDQMSLECFARHMEEVYQFVTPGNMGLNRAEMFSDGTAAFALSRGIILHPHVFSVSGYFQRNRPQASELAEFVKAGLSEDCPLGFLNLTRGRVKTLQSWHWITITSADIEENSLIATASDEGKQIRFDLRLWYLSTRMSGGLVYFT